MKSFNNVLNFKDVFLNVHDVVLFPYFDGVKPNLNNLQQFLGCPRGPGSPKHCFISNSTCPPSLPLSIL